MNTQPHWLSNIGWPHVSLLFLLFFIVIFRKEISALIQRIRSVGKDGVSITPQEIDQPKAPDRQDFSELMNIDSSSMLAEVEQSIEDELNKKGLALDSDASRVLARHLAFAQIALEFEQIDNAIFGSQILLLKRLNENRESGLPILLVESHCNEVRNEIPALAEWSNERYVSYLLFKHLVVFNDGHLHISVKGAEFLIWQIKTGRKIERPL